MFVFIRITVNEYAGSSHENSLPTVQAEVCGINVMSPGIPVNTVLIALEFIDSTPFSLIFVLTKDGRTLISLIIKSPLLLSFTTETSVKLNVL